MRGFFAIGILHSKNEINIGTLWRTAYQLGASYIFTIGRRYKTQSSDTLKTWKHVPLFHYQNWEHFKNLQPKESLIIGIEMGGTPLASFEHPERAVYVLGAEDNGLGKAIEKCHRVVSLEAVNQLSYNVAVAGSIVMYDRLFK